MKIERYKKKIIAALRSEGRYNGALESQITALAGALRSLEIANAEIDGLEVTTVMEMTRYGSKMAPHPAFKVQRDAQDSVTRQMKILGLTAAALSAGDEQDELVELTRKVKNMRGVATGAVYPDDDGR